MKRSPNLPCTVTIKFTNEELNTLQLGLKDLCDYTRNNRKLNKTDKLAIIGDNESLLNKLTGG